MIDRVKDAGRYDYVVVGAGSSGCVLANRLSARETNRVLVLEAGGLDNWIWFHIPVGYLFAIGNPRADWMFETETEAGLNGRALPYPRGKVIGGSSAINAMIYMRGQAADYDNWRQLGLDGWGWEDVLPFFLKHEDHLAPPNAMHRSGGELRVEPPRVRWDILDAVRDAAETLGIRKIDDFNAGDNEGSSYFDVNQKLGRRFSAARAFLKPALKRPNLRLETAAHVESIVFENGRAKGVVFTQNGERQLASVDGEVILSAGAVASPTILERSGVGSAKRLSDLGIPVTADVPGVGENLQDHLQIRPVFKVSGVRTLNTDYANLFSRAMMGVNYALRRRGPLTMAPSQLGIFAKSSERYATANLEFHIQPLSLDKWGDGLHRFGAFTASVANLRPSSRGSVHIRGAGADEKPSIRPNYLSTEEDREVAVESIRLTRRIVAQAPLARFQPEEYKPGPALQSDADLVKAAGDVATTIFHPVGTAKMGTADDPMAVVDARLRVRGVQGVRVIDASIMPQITSGNTNAPSMMIGEKGAAMVLEDRG
ncbi:MAG TPA: GMC family oxidoreductase N-terminal domain-containing protein [Rhizobiaceae bacterium]|nr:GMC family oxidoreductase N-terminal domain-containing protein [Rhizobiaceae bacterium]